MSEDNCAQGWGGDDCSIQQCSIEDDGGFCHMGGDCISEDNQLNWHCECHEGFTTSGFDCLVSNPQYLNHTISYVFLSIGIALLLVGITWVVLEYKNFVPTATDEEERLEE